MGDGDEDDLGVVESVDEAEGKSTEHVALMAGVDAGPALRRLDDGVEDRLDRRKEFVAEAGRGFVVLVGGVGSSPRWRRAGFSAVGRPLRFDSVIIYLWRTGI